MRSKNIFQKRISLFFAGAALCAVLLVLTGACSVQAGGVGLDNGGELYIGETQVTRQNCADIFGDGTASYDPDTYTLTLNGAHIDKDHCYKHGIGDDQTPVTNGYPWICSPLYAKNTILHLVINGNNTFETPVIKGLQGGVPNGSQLNIWDGIVIDSSGFSGQNVSITGSGSLTCVVPPIEPNEKTGLILPYENNWGGIALVWETGNGAEMNIGEKGGKGPVLNLYGACLGAKIGRNRAYAPLAITVHSGEVNCRAFLDSIYGYGYGTMDSSPRATALYLSNSSMTLEGEDVILRLAVPGIFLPQDTVPSMASVLKTEGKDLKAIAEIDESGYDGYSDWYCWLTDERAEELKKEADERKEAESRRKKGLDPTEEDGGNASIDVRGFTKDKIVYSVDVEWGAMTFQYENSIWDPVTHRKQTGAGWNVYDSERGEALGVTEDTVNEVKVTNHSNAAVYATLAYEGTGGGQDFSDISGSFSFDGALLGDAEKDALKAKFHAKTENAPAYLALATADNASDKSQAGTPDIAKAYFMPEGLSEDHERDGIAKWNRIGTITVGICIEEP